MTDVGKFGSPEMLSSYTSRFMSEQTGSWNEISSWARSWRPSFLQNRTATECEECSFQRSRKLEAKAKCLNILSYWNYSQSNSFSAMLIDIKVTLLKK